MSKSTYFYYHGKKYLDSVNKRVEKDKQILKIVKPIYFKNKSRYGSRRIILSIPSKELERLNVGRDRIRRILKVNGLLGVQGRNQRYHSYKGDNGLEKINLLLTKIVNEKTNKVTYKRNFKADAPNQIWATDVSEFKIASGKVYLSPVLDLFDSSIVAYDVSLHPNLDQIKRMLKRSFSKNDKLEGLIFHSDQGWQYQNPFYVSELEKRGIKQSFSRKGNCMDNSKMENFFGIMKNEMFYGHEGEFKTLDELMKAIKQYINYYNNKRINVKRKGLSPIAYRQQSFEGVQFKN